MERPLLEGDSVILSTGAVATVRRSYPAGYCGPVDILLDGVEEAEMSEGLTLPRTDVHATQPDSDDAPFAEGRSDDQTGSRAPGVKMED